MFSDESTFRQFGNYNITVWRPSGSSPYEPKYVVPTVKHAPSVMVWGAFSAQGRAGLAFLNEPMNSERYIWVLDEHLLTFMDINGCTVSQHDGAPCHASRRVKTWLQEKDINVLPWPGNSPGLNIIHRRFKTASIICRFSGFVGGEGM